MAPSPTRVWHNVWLNVWHKLVTKPAPVWYECIVAANVVAARLAAAPQWSRPCPECLLLQLVREANSAGSEVF